MDRGTGHGVNRRPVDAAVPGRTWTVETGRPRFGSRLESLPRWAPGILQASVSPSGSGDRDYHFRGLWKTQDTMVVKAGAQSPASLFLLTPSKPLGLLPVP